MKFYIDLLYIYVCNIHMIVYNMTYYRYLIMYDVHVIYPIYDETIYDIIYICFQG